MTDETITDEDIQGALDWIASLGRWPDDESPEQMICRMGVGEEGTQLAVSSILAMFVLVLKGEWPPIPPGAFAIEARRNDKVHEQVRRFGRTCVEVRGSLSDMAAERRRWVN